MRHTSSEDQLVLVLLLVLVLVAHFVRACALTHSAHSSDPKFQTSSRCEFQIFPFANFTSSSLVAKPVQYCPQPLHVAHCPIYTDHCAISTSPANRLNCVEEEIAHSVEILWRWDLYGDKGTVNLASRRTAQCLPVLPTRHSVNETYDASPPWLRCSGRSLGK